MKEKTTKIRGFQTPRLMKYFLPPTHIIFYLPTLQSLWDWLLLIHPSVSHQTVLQLCLYLCAYSHLCFSQLYSIYLPQCLVE